MVAMPRRVTFLAAFWTFCLASCLQAYAQDSSPDSEPEPCNAPVATRDDNSPNVDVSIAEISFWGAGIQMPAPEQNEVAATVRNIVHGNSVENVVDEALERVREEWQDRGYFQVTVTGEAKTSSSNAVSQRISISVHVEEGFQYRLGEITFKNNKLITNVEALRSLFPIKDGDLFKRAAIAKGLESLKRAYANQGFVNFNSVPEPKFDDSSKLIFLNIDVDEGKQFYLGNMRLQGLSDVQRHKVLDSFLLKRGDVFNESLLQRSLEREKFPDCSCDGIQRHLDEKKGTIDISLDFRPCN